MAFRPSSPILGTQQLVPLSLGSIGALFLGFDLGKGFLILLVCCDITALDLCHQLCRGAGLRHGIQQGRRQGFQDGPLAGAAAVHQGRDLQQSVGTILGDADRQAPAFERIFAVLVVSSFSHCATSSIFTVVQLLDNGATQCIMGGGNGIAHVDKAALGQLFAVLVLLFCKVQVIHGLCIQPGIIKRREHLIRHGGQGLVLCRLGSGHFRFVNIRRVSGS